MQQGPIQLVWHLRVTTPRIPITMAASISAADRLAGSTHIHFGVGG
ncbi:MAG TPA: hypothetical protein VMF06_07620 [Candidatus Limnocylindria bacterium]|nr:hypothetical protein [Candidatus Limnocylindria bacterium]